jgi:hypothetical protein
MIRTPTACHRSPERRDPASAISPAVYGSRSFPQRRRWRATNRARKAPAGGQPGHRRPQLPVRAPRGRGTARLPRSGARPRPRCAARGPQGPRLAGPRRPGARPPAGGCVRPRPARTPRLSRVGLPPDPAGRLPDSRTAHPPTRRDGANVGTRAGTVCRASRWPALARQAYLAGSSANAADRRERVEGPIARRPRSAAHTAANAAAPVRLPCVRFASPELAPLLRRLPSGGDRGAAGSVRVSGAFGAKAPARCRDRPESWRGVKSQVMV